jgi:hypothetical protein
MKIKENLWVVLVIICVAIITRIIPHYPNFTALGAAALFGGAYMSRKYGFLIPIVALFLSDLILNNLLYAKQFPHAYDGFVLFVPQTLWTYGALVLIVIMGNRFIREGKLLSIIGTSVGASVVFFLITNFAVWPGSTIYPKSIEGLLMSYGAGIPFFWNTLIGDLFFVAVFFGGYALAKTFLFSKARTRQTSH